MALIRVILSLHVHECGGPPVRFARPRQLLVSPTLVAMAGLTRASSCFAVDISLLAIGTTRLAMRFEVLSRRTMGLEEPLALSAVAAVPRIIMTATIAAVAPAARYQRVFDFGAIGSA